MALPLPQLVSSQSGRPKISLQSSFLPSAISWKRSANSNKVDKNSLKLKKISLTITCATIKHVRDRSMDNQVVKHNKVRFVNKLKTLLLSKPKHYLPIQILHKCRSYLSVYKPKSLITMIYRYPTIFELFTIPLPPRPLNATKAPCQLCVRLTPAAAALANEELKLKSAMASTLAAKLQKLLMLSSHKRLLLSKLVHLAPDLGLPPNFRSRLCNEHPDKFKTVDTSYGRALELVSWDPHLAIPLPAPDFKPRGLIVDRPLKFRNLRLRKGLNVKRCHQEFLVKFGEITDVCPYNTPSDELAKESLMAEKRACDVVREVLGMMVEKRTLVDHLTHFRNEFGLSNRLRAMLMRHPEFFYVSLKGQRDSVFLVEGYDDEGKLLEKDATSMINSKLMGLVMEGKRMRRERKLAKRNKIDKRKNDEVDKNYDDDDLDENEDFVDSLDDLFGPDNSDSENEEEEDAAMGELVQLVENGEFWSIKTASPVYKDDSQQLDPW